MGMTPTMIRSAPTASVAPTTSWKSNNVLIGCQINFVPLWRVYMRIFCSASPKSGTFNSSSLVSLSNQTISSTKQALIIAEIA